MSLSLLAVCRYYLGRPFHRLAGSQAMLGVPRPEATQWELSEQVGDSGHGVFRHLEHLAAQGELLSQDDTAVRMLSLVQEHQGFAARAEALGLSRSQERPGMYTTALVVKVGKRTICWYSSGRSHAGEHLASLLTQRQAGRHRPLVMSDALSRNEADEAHRMRCHCLAHGRRKCSELAEGFPHECQVVLAARKQGLDHDEVARKEQRGEAARLADHQA